ncbi:MAG: hypothetical protein ABIZ34_03845 [Candidatus Limnocylindrales bacterium]
MATLRAELLFTPDCPNVDRAEMLLRSILFERGLTVAIDRVPITDLDDAARLGFRGSPTVRIDGSDVAPDPNGEVGLSCRLYLQPDGRLDGIPSAEDIRSLLPATLEP